MARMRLLAGFAILTIVAMRAGGGAATPVLVALASWPQFRLNSANNAVLAGTLDVSWRIRTGGAFSSSAAFGGTSLFIGNNEGEVYSVDARSGRIRWRRHLANPVMSAPILYDGVVIVWEGNENSPTDAMPARPIHVGNGPNAIIGLDERTGKLLWTHALAGTGMPTPAIVDGILVHHDGDGSIIGLDPRTGAQRYARNIGSIASMVAALPVGHGDWVTAGESRNAIWDLRASDGSVVWKTTFSRVASGIGDCPPVSDGTRIYCDYLMPPSSTTPVLVGDLGRQHVYAIDVRTGRKAWDTALESGNVRPRNEAAIPLLADHRLFVGSPFAPYMHALDPRNGREIWRARTHGPVLGGAAAVDGTIYFGDLGGYLWALDARTGRTIGDAYYGAPFNVGSPVIAGRTLVIGSRGGTLLAVPLRDIRSSRAP